MNDVAKKLNSDNSDIILAMIVSLRHLLGWIVSSRTDHSYLPLTYRFTPQLLGALQRAKLVPTCQSTARSETTPQLWNGRCQVRTAGPGWRRSEQKERPAASQNRSKTGES